jgi:alanine racemase
MENRRGQAIVDLDAIENNLKEMAHLTKKGTKMISVIKADGYGHGAVELSRVIEPLEFIYGFATATVEEAVTLRQNGVKKPIFVLGFVFEELYETAAEHDIGLTVFSLDAAKQMSQTAGQCGKELTVHIKLDTGMGRIGYPVTEESADEIAQIMKLPYINVESIFTHFSKADERDKTYAHEQLAKYDVMIQMLEQRGVSIPLQHCSNSAGIIDMPEANKDMVRAGITQYGLWPSDEVCKERIYLEPAMSVVSHVVHVKDIKEGDKISYGGTFEAREPMRVATIPLGYADGYPRTLSNKGWVLIHGKKARILGRVCMDQFMVDVTNIEDVQVADKVTLIGRDGDETITMELLGDLSSRFNYELACDINKRIPRIYVKNGKEVAKTQYKPF